MNELIVKQFENTDIGIIEINGEIHFEVYSVGMALGHVKTAKGNEYPRKERIDESIKNAEIIPVVHNGQLYINEAQLYDFMFEIHTEKVKPFKKWVTSEVLPTLRKTGTYTIGNKQQAVPFKEQLEGAAFVADDLHVPQSNKIMMFRLVCESNNVPSNFLPVYAENEDREAKPVTVLLEEFHCEIKVVSFNKLLLKAGILEERERKSTSSKTGVKKFKALTEKGLKYRKNLTCEKNTKETQPYYYVDTFQELYNLVVQEVA